MALPKALADATWLALGAVFYLGVIATVAAYAIWARLLHLYSAALVAPFALLAPCVGALASATVFGEQFGPLRLAGMTAMLFGLAIVLLPLVRYCSVLRKPTQVLLKLASWLFWFASPKFCCFRLEASC